jgi:hypothetical protein
MSSSKDYVYKNMSDINLKFSLYGHAIKTLT